MTSPQTYLSIPETAKLFREAGFNVTAAQVRRWVRGGRLDSVRLPNGRAQVRLSDAVAVLGEHAS